MTDFEKVIEFENMYRAYRRAKCGKSYKKSSAKFNLMALDGVNTLIEQLKNKTYTISEYTEFKVYEPKERIIKTTSFKDKVIQHSLCDNVLMPRLQDIFIYDNCAGQKGKGTLFGLNRLSEQMLEFYNQHGFDGYILKCDITKFFYSIPHEKLKEIVHYHFGYDKDLCWLCDLFIDSTDGLGLPLGNQVNQGFALLYLDGMDKLIKYDLGIEFYGRYMDDFYLIHHDKEYLKHCLEAISKHLETLGLTLNGKTQIFPFKNGVNYLGFHTYVTTDGKVIRKLKNQNKRNAQKKFVKMAKLVAAGKLPIEKFNSSYGAWKNHISHGNCYKLGKAMDEKINEILKGDVLKVYIDSREKKCDHIKAWFDKNGIEYKVKKLDVGDFMLPDNPNVSVDRKQNLSELSRNLTNKADHSRFWKEVRRAKEQGIKLYILCEHGGKIKSIQDVALWNDKYSGVNGRHLMDEIYRVHISYGVEFIFTDKRCTARRIIEILTEDNKNDQIPTLRTNQKANSERSKDTRRI